MMMMKTLFVTGVLFAIACATQQGSSKDYVLTGDTCAVHPTEQACDAHADCEWSAGCACPGDAGPCPPCPAPVCVTKGGSEGSGSGSGSSGSGSGSSGSGSGSGIAGCACIDGGVCFEQIGGPATQAGSGEPDIQCYPPSACPGGCSNVCDEIVGQGTCAPDPDVVNLCLCDNGIR